MAKRSPTVHHGSVYSVLLYITFICSFFNYSDKVDLNLLYEIKIKISNISYQFYHYNFIHFLKYMYCINGKGVILRGAPMGLKVVLASDKQWLIRILSVTVSNSELPFLFHWYFSKYVRKAYNKLQLYCASCHMVTWCNLFACVYLRHQLSRHDYLLSVLYV